MDNEDEDIIGEQFGEQETTFLVICFFVLFAFLCGIAWLIGMFL
jgi:hypothetical protein